MLVLNKQPAMLVDLFLKQLFCTTFHRTVTSCLVYSLNLELIKNFIIIPQFPDLVQMPQMLQVGHGFPGGEPFLLQGKLFPGRIG
jgi:hypothetical protein